MDPNLRAWPSLGTQWSGVSITAARAPRAATLLLRRSNGIRSPPAGTEHQDIELARVSQAKYTTPQTRLILCGYRRPTAVKLDADAACTSGRPARSAFLSCATCRRIAFQRLNLAAPAPMR